MTDDPDTIPVAPAEAATEIGADYDGALPEGAAIPLLLVAVVMIVFAVAIVHLITGFVT